jgi:hypothetical protein
MESNMDLLEKAKAMPEKISNRRSVNAKWYKYIPIIMTLREKNYSFTEIANFLNKNADAKCNYATVYYAYRRNQYKSYNGEMNEPTR